LKVRNHPLTLGDIVKMNIMASAAAMGTAGIPPAGLLTLIMVLESAGLHPGDVSLPLVN
jgi:Na+/H+-dicarboxylate symporter